MPTRFLTGIVALGVMLAGPSVLLAQGNRPARAAAEVKPTPRLPDGKPDLAGVWTQHRDSPNRFFSDAQGRIEAPVTLAEQAMRPEAREKYKAQLAAGKVRSVERDLYDPSIKACAPLGFTRLIAQGRPFEILNTPGRVFVRYEVDHFPRDIWLDGREHPKDAPPTWMGHSTGKWDGDTLVVDTVGLNEVTFLDSPGHPHSEALHVVERYTRVNHDTLEIETTFEDPEVYTKPLVGNKLLYRLVPDGQIAEWVQCDDRIRLVLETDVCAIHGAWEYEAYCKRREAGLPVNIPDAGPPEGY